MKPPSPCVESLLPRFFPDGGEEGVDGGPAAHERLHFGPDLRNGGTPPVGLVLELVDLHAGLDEPLPRPHAFDKLEGEAVFLRVAPGCPVMSVCISGDIFLKARWLRIMGWSW